MILTGTIKKIGELVERGNFVKREVILLTDEKFPQPIAIDFSGNNVDMIDAYQLGENVNIHINIRGREWTSPQGEVKYFNSIGAWKVERVGEAPKAQQQASAPAEAQKAKKEVADDLPF